MKTKTVIIVIIFILLLVGVTLYYKNGKIGISKTLLPEMTVLDLGVPDLPVPFSNNAVAIVDTVSGAELYSFFGLQQGKAHSDISNMAYRLKFKPGSLKDAVWQRIRNVPVTDGRLASVAVTVNEEVYIFGGYTVAADGKEISQPEVFRFSPQTLKYTRLKDMPTPVDDAVAYAYQDRFVYLISGWHDKDNVSLVQIYDTQSDQWSTATEFPGAPVFGHSGGMVGNTLLVCDGVKLFVDENEKRNFIMSPECFRGEIEPSDMSNINWTKTSSHPGPAGYRMAAYGDPIKNKVYFFGGSDNPYNYDGVGYNKIPSRPMTQPFSYDIKTGEWEQFAENSQASMDHRGMVMINGVFMIVGGMDANQNVIAKVLTLSYPILEDD